MKTPEEFMDYLAAHRDCTEEVMEYARMLLPEDIEMSTEPKIVQIRKMIHSVMLEIHRMRGFIKLVPISDTISYGHMESEHRIGHWVAESIAHRHPHTEIILGNEEHTWSANYSGNGMTHSEGPGIIEALEERKKKNQTDKPAGMDTEKLWMTYYLRQYCPGRKSLRPFQKQGHQAAEKPISAEILSLETPPEYENLANYC